MAYDDPAYRRSDLESTDPVGLTARDDAWGGSASSELRDRGLEPTRRGGVSGAALDDVFDDPAHGEPGRDRIAVHLLWEVALLAATAAIAFLLYRESSTSFRGHNLDTLLVAGSVLGLLALAAGLTLRAGVPNLALGPVTIAAALHFAENGDRGVVNAVLPAAAVAVVGGLIVAVIVVGFHVPAWAATFAAGLAVVVYIQQRSAPVGVQGEFDPTAHARYLFGGFAALSLLGGLLGSIRTVRRSVGRFRPVGDPAYRRGRFAGALAGAAIVTSTVFAVLAGILLVAGSDRPASPTPGFEWTGLALGAALLGGTSAFGRRGGIFGTIFSVTLITLFVAYSDERRWHVSLFAVGAAAIAVGLGMTRLVETYGRPRPATDPGDRGRGGQTAAAGWGGGASDRTETWSSALPAQPTDSRPDLWGTERWTGGDRG